MLSHRKTIHRLACSIFALIAILGVCFQANGEDFDWRNVNGQNYVTPVRSQVLGTCWAYAAVAALEARYKITRNDPTFNPDCSEWLLVTGGAGTTDGGWPHRALTFFIFPGIISEAELPPYTGEGTSPYLPLPTGWQDNTWRINAWYETASDVETVKQAMKSYGPITSIIWSGSHAVALTGFHDDASLPGGGYWIFKNSWGTGYGDNGYGTIGYDELLNDPSAKFYAINSVAYRTSPLATANWEGATNIWTVGNSNWTSDGSAHAWVNEETDALFDANTNNQVTIGGTAIAHGLTLNTGATGYTFSGGSLTVTGGGIMANESVDVNVPVTLGAPQTWTVAAGKTLTIGGSVHENISSLTIDGAGDTYIQGDMDGNYLKGLRNGAVAGVVKNGTGTLTLSGANTYAGGTTINSGTLVLADTGSMLMDINDPNVDYTQYFGAGSLILDGGLLLDVADVTVTSGSWMLIDDSLTVDYGSTFYVQLVGCDAFEAIGDLFAYTDALNHYWTFNGTTGILAIAIPEPGATALLALGLIGLFIWRIRN